LSFARLFSPRSRGKLASFPVSHGMLVLMSDGLHLPGVTRPERIRAVAFDAVGTLIHPDPPVAAIYEEISRRHGSRLTRDDVARRFRDAFAIAETEMPDDPAE